MIMTDYDVLIKISTYIQFMWNYFCLIINWKIQLLNKGASKIAKQNNKKAHVVIS